MRRIYESRRTLMDLGRRRLHERRRRNVIRRGKAIGIHVASRDEWVHVGNIHVVRVVLLQIRSGIVGLRVAVLRHGGVLARTLKVREIVPGVRRHKAELRRWLLGMLLVLGKNRVRSRLQWSRILGVSGAAYGI